MPFPRRAVFLAVLTAIPVAPAAAAEAGYPSRPVRLVVPFAPGAATDNLARMVGLQLADRLGQPVVVDNRPGGGGTTGTDLVAKATADGHTLLMASTSLSINQTLHRNLPYDAVKDFATVCHLVDLPNTLLAPTSLPAKNVGELIALARKEPGKINYGSGGTGSAAHLAMELLKSQAKVEMVHVPYRGGALAMTDLTAGRISAMFISVYTGLPHVRAGRLKSLGVASEQRVATVPDWPTLGESGLPGFVFNAWYGIMAPAGTPPDVVERLNREIVAVMKQPDIRDRTVKQGAVVVASTTGAFAKLLRAEVDKWGAVVKSTGATAN